MPLVDRVCNGCRPVAAPSSISATSCCTYDRWRNCNRYTQSMHQFIRLSCCTY
jgi:hypothetical protein